MRIIKNEFAYCLAIFAIAFGLLHAPASLTAQQRDSLDLKIGQMLMIGFPKAEVDANVLREIREGKVGAVIIFEKNIPAKNSFVELKKITWTYQEAAAIPLLIAIDQEGGKVNRLKDKYGFPRSITAESLGKAGAVDSVRFYAEATAATIAGLGINVNFAPVVDLAVNPMNPVIVKHGRAYSNNEDTVVMMAREVIIQHRKYGVITSLKHFPGHGSSEADTHLGIADVTKTWSERELIPYQRLIGDGYADAVMSSHIVHRDLDKAGRPGTLSHDILTGILRNKLNFQGVIFSDDMQMHAITKHFGLEEAIKLAVIGGIDIMTFSNNISGSEQRTVDKVHAIIRRMVESGEIPKSRIDESYRRIMALKKSLNQKNVQADMQRELAALHIEQERCKSELVRLTTENQKLANELQNVPTKKKKKRNKKR